MKARSRQELLESIAITVDYMIRNVIHHHVMNPEYAPNLDWDEAAEAAMQAAHEWPTPEGSRLLEIVRRTWCGVGEPLRAGPSDKMDRVERLAMAAEIARLQAEIRVRKGQADG